MSNAPYRKAAVKMARRGWASRRSLLGGAALALLGVFPASAQVADLVDKQSFRVCADPANVPLSAKDGSGFENKIAALFAERLDRPLHYTWFPQVTGYVRQTLSAGKCDVVMGAPQGDDLLLNTNHYYTSTHVMVTKADGDLAGVTNLSDPKLQGRRAGVVAGSPVTSHAARHGMMKRAKPYDLMIDRRVEDPAGDMLRDVLSGETDFALMWGPIAGPLVKEMSGLVVIPLVEETLPPRLFFRITMGVRAGEIEWKHQLNSLIRRNQAEIDAILRAAGVPLVDDYGKTLKAPD